MTAWQRTANGFAVASEIRSLARSRRQLTPAGFG